MRNASLGAEISDDCLALSCVAALYLSDHLDWQSDLLLSDSVLLFQPLLFVSGSCR